MVNQLNDRHGLTGTDFFFDLQEADDIGYCLFEIGIDPDPFIRLRIEPIEGEGELVQPGFNQLAAFVLVKKRAVRMEPGDEASVVGISGHLEKIWMEERFAPVEEMDVENEAGRFVNDLFEQAEVHIALLGFFEVFIRAHDAAEVTDACRLDPEADGKIGKPGPLSFIIPKNSGQPEVIKCFAHHGEATSFYSESPPSVYHSRRRVQYSGPSLNSKEGRED